MARTAVKGRRRRTTTVPVTTMEEIPVLSEKERAELRTALEQAGARVNAGKAIEFDAETLKARLLDVYRSAKRKR